MLLGEKVRTNTAWKPLMGVAWQAAGSMGCKALCPCDWGERWGVFWCGVGISRCWWHHEPCCQVGMSLPSTGTGLWHCEDIAGCWGVSKRVKKRRESLQRRKMQLSQAVKNRKWPAVIYCLTCFAGPNQGQCLQIDFRLMWMAVMPGRAPAVLRFHCPIENGFNLNKRQIKSCCSSTVKHAQGPFLHLIC